LLPALDQIDFRTLRDQANQSLRTALRQGQFEPGQKMTIRGLSAALGVSPTPIREALHGLAAEGAVEVLPNRLIRIPLLTTERLVELRDLRVLLEGQATELAVARFGPAEIAALDAAEAAIVAQRGKPDVKAMIRAIGEFHFTIYGGSARPILVAFIESLWLRGAPYVNYLFPGYAGRERGKLRGQTLAAIRRGDAKAARASMERDIAEAADFVIAISKSDAYRARLAAAA